MEEELTYYERHKEERKAYQREYRKKRLALEHAKLENEKKLNRHKFFMNLAKEFNKNT